MPPRRKNPVDRRLGRRKRTPDAIVTKQLGSEPVVNDAIECKSTIQ